MSKVKKKVRKRIAQIKADQHDPNGSKRKAAMATASMTLGEILEAAKSSSNKRRK